MATEIMYELNSYLTFRMEAELFAVNIGQVIQIIEPTPITKVPNSPRHLKGMINHFGDVLPVFDGRLKFGFSASQQAGQQCILVLVFDVDGQPTKAGITIDSLEKVMYFEPSQIQTARALEKDINLVFIHGMTTVEDEMALILDVDKLFSEDEINCKNAVE